MYLRFFYTLVLSQKIHNTPPSIRIKNKLKHKSDFYPCLLPGSKTVSSNTTDPILDFIKCICRLLELDPFLKSHIITLKNNLLRITGTGAFAPKAEYNEISNSKIIIDIPCEFCSSTSDIDICNNLKLLSEIEERKKNKSSTPTTFICNNCSEPLLNANNAIELALLEELKNITSTYYNQDIKCEKCKDVSGHFLKKICKKDARNYKNTIKKSHIRRKLNSLRLIARCYDFEILKESIDFQVNSLRFV